MGPSDRKRGLEFLLVSMEGRLLLPPSRSRVWWRRVPGQCPTKAPPRRVPPLLHALLSRALCVHEQAALG